MPKERRSYTGVEKMAFLREHLIEKVPISEVCAKRGLQPTVFYGWQKRLFEEGAAVFESAKGERGKSSRRPSAQARRIEALEAKLRHKDEVMTELLGEHVAPQKSLGEI